MERKSAMIELRRAARTAPELKIEGLTPGEFAERFVFETAGRSPERVAIMVYRAIDAERRGAEAVREEAARLVQKHCARLGMDLFAAKALIDALRKLDVGNVAK